MSTLVTVVHMVSCGLLVLVVLLQSGKGAEISASFAGSSQTVFGSSGGANFFTKFTSVMAAIFMATSLSLTLMSGQSKKSLFETSPLSGSAPVGATAPAAVPANPNAVPANSAAAPANSVNSAAKPAVPVPAEQKK